MDKRSGRAIALAAAMQGVGGGLGWSLVPALMPEMAKDLGVTKGMAGVIWGAASLGIALAAPLGGAAVDRFGPRRVAGAAMAFGAVACAARVLAVGPWTLALTMLLFGAHVGFVAPAVPKALAGEVELSRLGRANGLALLAYTLGTALTMLVARTVLSPALGGWRSVMLVAAGLMAVVAGLWTLGTRDTLPATRHASLADVFRLARHGELRKIAMMHFLIFGGYIALLGTLPHALTEAGMSPSRVGLAICAWLVVAGFANVLGPTISERIGLRRPVFIGGALVCGGALLLLALVGAKHGVWFLPIAAAGGGCIAPLLLTAPLELDGIGPQKAGGALGLLMLVGQAGGALLPVVTGAIAQPLGFSWALGLLAVVHLGVLVPALALRETGRRAGATSVPTSDALTA